MTKTFRYRKGAQYLQIYLMHNGSFNKVTTRFFLNLGLKLKLTFLNCVGFLLIHTHLMCDIHITVEIQLPFLYEYIAHLQAPLTDWRYNIQGLSFNENYTVRVYSYDSVGASAVESKAAITWFVTPDCLPMLDNNLTVCGKLPNLNYNITAIYNKTENKWIQNNAV